MSVQTVFLILAILKSTQQQFLPQLDTNFFFENQDYDQPNQKDPIVGLGLPGLRTPTTLPKARLGGFNPLAQAYALALKARADAQHRIIDNQLRYELASARARMPGLPGLPRIPLTPRFKLPGSSVLGSPQQNEDGGEFEESDTTGLFNQNNPEAEFSGVDQDALTGFSEDLRTLLNGDDLFDSNLDRRHIYDYDLPEGDEDYNPVEDEAERDARTFRRDLEKLGVLTHGIFRRDVNTKNIINDEDLEKASNKEIKSEGVITLDGSNKKLQEEGSEMKTFIDGKDLGVELHHSKEFNGKGFKIKDQGDNKQHIQKVLDEKRNKIKDFETGKDFNEELQRVEKELKENKVKVNGFKQGKDASEEIKAVSKDNRIQIKDEGEELRAIKNLDESKKIKFVQKRSQEKDFEASANNFGKHQDEHKISARHADMHNMKRDEQLFVWSLNNFNNAGNNFMRDADVEGHGGDLLLITGDRNFWDNHDIFYGRVPQAKENPAVYLDMEATRGIGEEYRDEYSNMGFGEGFSNTKNFYGGVPQCNTDLQVGFENEGLQMRKEAMGNSRQKFKNNVADLQVQSNPLPQLRMRNEAGRIIKEDGNEKVSHLGFGEAAGVNSQNLDDFYGSIPQHNANLQKGVGEEIKTHQNDTEYSLQHNFYENKPQHKTNIALEVENEPVKTNPRQINKSENEEIKNQTNSDPRSSRHFFSKDKHPLFHSLFNKKEKHFEGNPGTHFNQGFSHFESGTNFQNGNNFHSQNSGQFIKLIPGQMTLPNQQLIHSQDPNIPKLIPTHVTINNHHNTFTNAISSNGDLKIAQSGGSIAQSEATSTNVNQFLGLINNETNHREDVDRKHFDIPQTFNVNNTRGKDHQENSEFSPTTNRKTLDQNNSNSVAVTNITDQVKNGPDQVKKTLEQYNSNTFAVTNTTYQDKNSPDLNNSTQTINNLFDLNKVANNTDKVEENFNHHQSFQVEGNPLNPPRNSFNGPDNHQFSHQLIPSNHQSKNIDDQVLTSPYLLRFPYEKVAFHKRNSQHDLHKRSLPLVRLIADPNTKLDMPKTLENVGTIAKNSFDDKRAPIYHVKNMLGATKDAFLSTLKIAPQNIIIPSRYRIIDTNNEIVMKPGDIQAIKDEARAAVEEELRSNNIVGKKLTERPLLKLPTMKEFFENLKLKNDIFSQPKINEDLFRKAAFTPTKKRSSIPEPNEEDPFNFLGTFQKVGSVIRDSIKSSHETVSHINNAAHSARKAFTTSKFALPKILLPYTTAPVVRSTLFDDNLMMISPRFLDVTEDVNQQDPNGYVKMGEIMDAFGMSKPGDGKIGLSRIIIQKRKENPLLQSRFGDDGSAPNGREYYVISESIDEPDNVESIAVETVKSLHDIMNTIGVSNLKDFLAEMKRELFTLQNQNEKIEPRFGIDKVKDEEEELKHFLEDLFKQNGQRIGVDNQQVGVSKNSPKLNHSGMERELLHRFIDKRISEIKNECVDSVVPKLQEDKDLVNIESKLNEEIVASGMNLPPDLFKPFMNQPSRSELEDYFREHGDDLDDVNLPEGGDGIRDFLKLSSINPDVYMRLFNESLMLNDNTTIADPAGLFKSIEDEPTLKSEADEENRRTIMKFHKKLLKPYMGKIKVKKGGVDYEDYVHPYQGYFEGFGADGDDDEGGIL